MDSLQRLNIQGNCSSEIKYNLYFQESSAPIRPKYNTKIGHTATKHSSIKKS